MTPAEPTWQQVGKSSPLRTESAKLNVQLARRASSRVDQPYTLINILVRYIAQARTTNSNRYASANSNEAFTGCASGANTRWYTRAFQLICCPSTLTREIPMHFARKLDSANTVMAFIPSHRNGRAQSCVRLMSTSQ